MEMEKALDWNRVMDIAKQLADLDFYVAVSSRVGEPPTDLGHGDRKVAYLQVSKMSSFEGKIEGIKSVHLDLETFNFLLAEGVVMDPDTFLASDYTQILTWLGMR